MGVRNGTSNIDLAARGLSWGGAPQNRLKFIEGAYGRPPPPPGFWSASEAIGNWTLGIPPRQAWKIGGLEEDRRRVGRGLEKDQKTIGGGCVD